MRNKIERILVSQKDAEIFLDALENYSEPNEKLKALSELYQDKIC